MERSEHAAIKIEATAPQFICAGAAFPAAKAWWLFCVLIFAIKFLLLWLDRTPKLFLGDSGAYIWTALTGWIPSDRSYFYGYLVRWLAVWPHSFGPLLLSQMLVSAVTAIMFVECFNVDEQLATSRLLFLAELLETRIIPQQIEHWIEPE